MRSFARLILLTLCLALSFQPVAIAQQAETAPLTEAQRAEMMAKVEVYLKPKQGKVALPGDFAVINVPETLGYLDPKQTEFLIEKLWGNPQGSGAGTLGTIVPTDLSIISPEAWGVVITFDEDGYVSDADAEKINYTELLGQMRDATAEANAERKDAGYPEITLVGWAQQPHYDKTAHKLYWAKELQFADSPTHGLNYDVRVLGRRGVLVMTGVGSMEQLPMLSKKTPEILSMVDFNKGHRYQDFDPNTDKVAEYGIAALVAGGAAAVAAKAGLFAKLIALLIAGKKFVIIAVVVVGAFIAKLFKRRKQS